MLAQHRDLALVYTRREWLMAAAHFSLQTKCSQRDVNLTSISQHSLSFTTILSFTRSEKTRWRDVDDPIQLSSGPDVNPPTVLIQLSSVPALNAYRRTASGMAFMAGTDES